MLILLIQSLLSLAIWAIVFACLSWVAYLIYYPTGFIVWSVLSIIMAFSIGRGQ